MTAQSLTERQFDVRLLGISFEQFRAAMVWLMMASSFIVIIEPAPVDFLFVIVLALYLWSGITPSVLIMPMIALLMLFNLGGFISYVDVSIDSKATMFVVTSLYMAVSAVFLAFYVAYDPVARMKWFGSGYVMGAFLGSVVALAGYFDVAGLAAALSPIQRAQGTFKDPNVLSTYIILPALFLIQAIMTGEKGFRLWRYVALLTILTCLFLSFSRGAWMNFAFSVAVTVALTFALTPSAALRSRIILLSAAGAATLAGIIAFLLSLEQVRNLFLDRLTLLKDYDAGETGRFGNQINSIPLLMERPLGFGPLRFGTAFDSDPHNVYINAFSAYGWLGGYSYVLLVIATMIVGFKGLLIRTPWQNASIAVFAAMVAVIFQGLQIDTDHWRHFYWMLGLTWGLFAASAMYVANSRLAGR